MKDGDELQMGSTFKRSVRTGKPAVPSSAHHGLSNVGAGSIGAGGAPSVVVDRPDLGDQSGTVRYGTPLMRPEGTRTPLFDGDPSREQIQQGDLNDCGYVATLGAIAGHRPEVIREAIRHGPGDNYEVRLHEARKSPDTDGRYEPTGRFISLTVTPELPVRSGEPGLPAFATGRGVAAWGPLMEKAIAGIDQTWDSARGRDWAVQCDRAGMEGVAPEGYARLNKGTVLENVAELLTQITGQPAIKSPIMIHSDRELYDEFEKVLSSRSPILVSTPKKPFAVDLSYNILPRHVYEVIRVDPLGDRIFLHNPWGRLHPQPMTIEVFRKSYYRLYVTLE